jgi:hypothetical protein
MSFTVLKKKPDTFDYEASRICRCCSNMFKGRYCNICGEKVIESNERSFLSFLDSLLNAFTFLDGKFIKSLKLLITRPGQLSRNIADGLRVPYMKMVSLFFVANFFYFLFPVFDSYNSSLYTQMNSLGQHSIRAREIVEAHIAESTSSMEQFQQTYQEKSTNLSKLLIIILVLALTLFLMVINFSRKAYFFDHLLYALEFYSFSLLINSVLLANMLRLIIKAAFNFGWDWRLLLSDAVFTIFWVLTIGYWLSRSQKIFYNQKWYWALVKTVALIFLIQFSVDFYRESLFYITMWLI